MAWNQSHAGKICCCAPKVKIQLSYTPPWRHNPTKVKLLVYCNSLTRVGHTRHTRGTNLELTVIPRSMASPHVVCLKEHFFSCGITDLYSLVLECWCDLPWDVTDSNLIWLLPLHPWLSKTFNMRCLPHIGVTLIFGIIWIGFRVFGGQLTHLKICWLYKWYCCTCFNLNKPLFLQKVGSAMCWVKQFDVET